METPLTPLEFARRARKLYFERVAVIDGDSRWTYAQFFDRCDRWSAALQKLGIGSRDRVVCALCPFAGGGLGGGLRGGGRLRAGDCVLCCSFGVLRARLSVARACVCFAFALGRVVGALVS